MKHRSQIGIENDRKNLDMLIDNSKTEPIEITAQYGKIKSFGYMYRGIPVKYPDRWPSVIHLRCEK